MTAVWAKEVGICRTEEKEGMDPNPPDKKALRAAMMEIAVDTMRRAIRAPNETDPDLT